MQIKYQNIILRDYQESDIDDDIRWNTVETEWGDWDAPWEKLQPIDPEEFRRVRLKRLDAQKTSPLLRLEIDTADGVHIGAVNSYVIDAWFNWQRISPGQTLTPNMRVALGIDICERAYWSGGWGTQALTAFVRYWLENGYQDIYTQTWSGNTRMIGLAKKLGFVECCREPGFRQVRGGTYDGLTFQLDPAAFEVHCGRTAFI